MIHLDNKRVLNISLVNDSFVLMLDGIKPVEHLKPVGSINSRLQTKKGIDCYYDYVRFTNGYGLDCPYIIAEYKGYYISVSDYTVKYPNGFTVEVEKGDYIIKTGKILETGNPNKSLFRF